MSLDDDFEDGDEGNLLEADTDDIDDDGQSLDDDAGIDSEPEAPIAPVRRASPLPTPRGRIKVKPMSDRMKRKHPNCLSLLVTTTDGAQILFTR